MSLTNKTVLYIREDSFDMFLVRWWIQMLADGEVDSIFFGKHRSLSGFLELVTHEDTKTLFQFDDKGIWIAVWSVPFLSGRGLGVWIRKDRRRKRIASNAVFELVRWHLDVGTVLFIVTQSRRVLQLAEHFGFRSLGVVPGLWRGLLGHVAYMTLDDYAFGRAMYEATYSTKHAHERGEPWADLQD